MEVTDLIKSAYRHNMLLETIQVFKEIQAKNDNSIRRKQVLSNDVTKNIYEY